MRCSQRATNEFPMRDRLSTIRRGHGKSKRLKYSFRSRTTPLLIISNLQPSWSLLPLIDCLKHAGQGVLVKAKHQSIYISSIYLVVLYIMCGFADNPCNMWNPLLNTVFIFWIKLFQLKTSEANGSLALNWMSVCAQFHPNPRHLVHQQTSVSLGRRIDLSEYVWKVQSLKSLKIPVGFMHRGLHSRPCCREVKILNR